MNRHYIIRESQFTLSEPEEIRRIGISPKAVKITMVLDTGGPITVDLQKEGAEEQVEISALHTMYDFATHASPRVHHVAVQLQTGDNAHGEIIVWGLVSPEPKNTETLSPL